MATSSLLNFFPKESILPPALKNTSMGESPYGDRHRTDFQKKQGWISFSIQSGRRSGEVNLKARSHILKLVSFTTAEWGLLPSACYSHWSFSERYPEELIHTWLHQSEAGLIAEGNSFRAQILQASGLTADMTEISILFAIACISVSSPVPGGHDILTSRASCWDICRCLRNQDKINSITVPGVGLLYMGAFKNATLHLHFEEVQANIWSPHFVECADCCLTLGRGVKKSSVSEFSITGDHSKCDLRALLLLLKGNNGGQIWMVSRTWERGI